MSGKYQGIPQLAYPFVPGATSPQDNARLSLEYADKHQNRLNNSLKGGKNVTIYNGGPFVKQSRGPNNGQSISMQTNSSLFKGQANSEYDHFAFKTGGKKNIRKSRKKRKLPKKYKGGVKTKKSSKRHSQKSDISNIEMLIDNLLTLTRQLNKEELLHSNCPEDIDGLVYRAEGLQQCFNAIKERYQ